MTVALEMISGRWKMQILYCVHFGENRFSTIKKRIPRISDRMLGLRLGDLIEDGLILKSIQGDDVVYALTAKAQRLIPVLNQITDWYVGK